MKTTLIILSALLTTPVIAEKKWDLPEGKGKPLVAQTCTKCHAARLILQQRQDRNGWNQTISRMQKENGLWDLDGETRKTILDYLETNLSPEASPDSRPVNPLPKLN